VTITPRAKTQRRKEKTMVTTRAKFKVTKVEDGTIQQVTMMAVTDAPFDPDGVSEDNSFARWTPSGELRIAITNPNLVGAFKEGDKFYLDFTKAAS
jgi:hypothetical protein